MPENGRKTAILSVANFGNQSLVVVGRQCRYCFATPERTTKLKESYCFIFTFLIDVPSSSFKRKQEIFVKKNRGFIDSKFGKICHEQVRRSLNIYKCVDLVMNGSF